MKTDWANDYSDWLIERVPVKEGKPDKWMTCGVFDGDELIGVAALFNWVGGEVVYFGAAGDGPRWMSRSLIKDILEQAFQKLCVKRMVAYTNVENLRTQGILFRFGFQHTETIKDGFGPGKDKLVYVLDRDVALPWMERLGSQL